MSDKKPCPFCGSDQVMAYCTYSPRYKCHFVNIRCEVCGASASGAKVHGECKGNCEVFCELAIDARLVAVSKWNRRA